MSEHGTQLLHTASRQIAELLELLSTRGQDALGLPCPGREQLGNGTVGATAQHASRVYHQLAGFIRANHQAPGPRSAREHDHHRQMHKPERIELQQLRQQLSAATIELSPLAELTGEQLQSVPPVGSFRFCDGQRTLERVIASVLRHQDHHITALNAALL
jgi:hypothetical protein